MSASNQNTTTESIELTTDADTADLLDAIESLAESNRQLVERVANLEAERDERDERIDDLESELAETQEKLEQTTDQLQDTKEELESVKEDLEDASDHRTSMAKDLAQTKGRVSELEDRDEGREHTSSRLERLRDTTETPMERVVALSEEVAEEGLTANQQRARLFARDVRDYTSKAPAGYVATSSDIRTVLAAMDESDHDETVNRVIDFLEDFGEEEVKVVKRRGVRRIVFSEGLVERLDAIETETITSCVIAERLEV